MIVKSYTAPTVAAALKKIREELGGEAVILRTREGREQTDLSARVEVTACIDERAARQPVRGIREMPAPEAGPWRERSGLNTTGGETEKTTDNLLKLDKSLNYSLTRYRQAPGEPPSGRAARSVYYNLLDADVAVEIAQRVVEQAEAQSGSDEDFETVACRVLEDDLSRVTATGIPIKPGSRLAFIGPGGAGKTSVMAKVAARLCANLKQKIKLVSLDQSKPSANGELDAYGRWLEVPVARVGEISGESRDEALVLIDTPPIAGDAGRRKHLLRQLEEVHPDLILLVFSVCSRMQDLIDNVIRFEPFAPHYLVASHLDVGDRWGGIPTMAEYMHSPVVFITDSPGSSGEIKSPEAAIIARQLLKMEVRQHV